MSGAGHRPKAPAALARRDVLLALPGVRTTPVSLTLPARLDAKVYARVCTVLGDVSRGVQWWAGDALVYGERTYGEDQFSQLAESLGYTADALTALRWVSDRIEAARRRPKLSWSHHREVAALTPREQDRWLARAEAATWTRAQLRKAIKEASGEAADGDEASLACCREGRCCAGCKCKR